jgi:hypothetical protein
LWGSTLASRQLQCRQVHAAPRREPPDLQAPLHDREYCSAARGCMPCHHHRGAHQPSGALSEVGGAGWAPLPSHKPQAPGGTLCGISWHSRGPSTPAWHDPGRVRSARTAQPGACSGRTCSDSGRYADFVPNRLYVCVCLAVRQPPCLFDRLSFGVSVCLSASVLSSCLCCAAVRAAHSSLCSGCGCCGGPCGVVVGQLRFGGHTRGSAPPAVCRKLP